MKTIEDIINKIYEDNDIWYEFSCISRNEVAINVEWGDWKHDHGYIDYLMEENGFINLGECVTEENGSDCYSSIHFYRKIKK